MRGYLWRAIPTAVAAASILTFAGAAASVTAAGATDIGRGGVAAPTNLLDGVPGAGKGADASLDTVTAVSTHDVWALGGRTAGGADHYDGHSWRWVDAPGGARSLLESVSAVSSGDIWAVGQTGAGTLTEHWDGRRWSLVQAVNPNTSDGFAGVAALTPTDVWAVGGSSGADGIHIATLIEHWDGASWSLVAGPKFPRYRRTALTGIDAVSPTDIWAVGYRQLNDRPRPLTEHWDGTSWRVVDIPTPPRSLIQAIPTGVTAIAPDDVWITGRAWSAETTTSVASVLRALGRDTMVGRDGPHFHAVATIFAVDGVARDDVWAVGWRTPVGVVTNRTLTVHWDGKTWTPVPSANPAGGGDQGPDDALAGVTAVGADDVWAVGAMVTTSGQSKQLMEHWNGQSWQVYRQ